MTKLTVRADEVREGDLVGGSPIPQSADYSEGGCSICNALSVGIHTSGLTGGRYRPDDVVEVDRPD